MGNRERINPWYELSAAEFVEAVGNLSATNLYRGATPPERIRDLIDRFEKSGEITPGVAKKLRDKVDGLVKAKEKKR